jgi:glycerol uptake facilitator-like aquaporin
MQIFEKIKIEFIGAFIMCLSIDLLGIQYSLNFIDVITYSLGVFMIMCCLLWNAKHVSNSQFNPVISFSLMITGHIKTFEGIILMIFQIIAAIFAASILKFSIPANY